MTDSLDLRLTVLYKQHFSLLMSKEKKLSVIGQFHVILQMSLAGVTSPNPVESRSMVLTFPY